MGLADTLAQGELVVEELGHILALQEEQLVVELGLVLNKRNLQVSQDKAIQLQKYYFPWESIWANLWEMGF